MSILMPREERDIGRIRFSEVVVGIVSRQLLPRRDAEGRVGLVEIMVATAPIRDALKDPARVLEVKTQMTKSYGKSGMQTYEQHLGELVKAGQVSPQTARALAGNEESAPAKGGGRR